MAYKLAILALLPLLAVGALVLAVLSLWSVDAAPQPEVTVRRPALEPVRAAA